MKIIFEKIVLHNFLSFGHSEVDLRNKSYCSVTGVNNCQEDGSKSNGSGKSSLFSGICWALTGQTIQGVTNVKNIYVDENKCYVELVFKVDNDEYIISRIKEPKSNLLLFKNGVDISGKGIKETTAILEEELPDLTYDLISSTILIGQGMPNKLSSLTPSGRKERLEKLSKADSMISDIKNRVTERSNYLYAQQRIIEDKTLQNETLTKSNQMLLEKTNKSISELEVKPDFDDIINKLESRIVVLQNSIDLENKNVDFYQSKLTELTNNKLSLSKEKQDELNEELTQYNEAYLEKSSTKNSLSSQIYTLNQEITRLKSISDICPTCGQKLIGVEKPSTETQEKELEELKTQLEEVKENITSIQNNHSEYVNEINNKYKEQEQTLLLSESNLNKTLKNINDGISKLNTELTDNNINLREISLEKENYDTTFNKLVKDRDELTNQLVTLSEEHKELETEKLSIQEHIDVIKKIETNIKRDFRGYLLQNVIKYISTKAKQYCSKVFNCTSLEFFQDGNNLSITFKGKEFESLSGGEKQKVDLILQFAIREMMSTYMGFSSNILVVDEIFDNLDAVGVENVLNLITDEIQDIESMFIISHHTDLDIPYDSEITIVKDENNVSEVI